VLPVGIESVKQEGPSLRSRVRGGLALVLAVLLSCQTDRPGRRTAVEPVGPLNEPVAPGSAAAASPSVTAASSAAATPAGRQAAFVPLTRPQEPLNVILLTVAGLRADMPWAGYPRAVAPHLTQLAAESTVWEQHRSVSSRTPPALGTLLSSRYPSSLYRDGALLTTFSTANWFFPELLQSKGIRTLGVQASAALAQGKGFEQGFDIWEPAPAAAAQASADSQSRSEPTLSRLIRLLGQQQNVARQFFAWAHLTEPEEPYLPHAEAPDFGTQARDRYDAEVFFVDLWVGKLLEFARAEPWWGRTALIVTGDHGADFGEHGSSKQGLGLWDALLQTPLIIHAPGAKPTRVSAARTHLDLAPTILELMGLTGAPPLRGQSLVGELYGAAAAKRPVLLFELTEDVENPGLRAMIAGEEKLVVAAAGGPERLFNLRADPREMENLAERRTGRLIELAVRFEREWARVPNVEPFGGMKLSSGRLARGPEHPPR
jgi:choline-sulfatase